MDCTHLVRCKDCEYSKPNDVGGYEGQLRCDHPEMDWDLECFDLWINVTPDGFCSWGVRREAENK